MAGDEPRAVAVGVLKGGFGKTTTAMNVARELAERSGRALLIDLDSNGHMTLSMGFGEAFSGDRWADGTNHVRDVLIDGTDPREYIVNVVDGLDLFPSHDRLEVVKTALKNERMGTTKLRQTVIEELLGDAYDYIVIDCPPDRGKLNDNAMYAARNIIIPLRPESGYKSGLQTQCND